MNSFNLFRRLFLNFVFRLRFKGFLQRNMAILGLRTLSLQRKTATLFILHGLAAYMLGGGSTPFSPCISGE